MTVRLPALQNHPAGFPAEEYRLGSARFLPSPTNGLTPFGGVLPAPAGYMGEVTLLGAETVRVNPAVWVVPGTQSGVQGAYVVPNDAAVERAIGPRDASLTRIDRLVVQARDTAYTPNDGVNEPDVRVLPGTPAASGAVAPGVPVNALDLGTINVPPGIGAVTFTPAQVRRQVAVGGVQPIPTGGATSDPGPYDGALRLHPTLGLQQWFAATTTWGPPTIGIARVPSTGVDVTLTSTGHPFQIGPSTGINLAVDENELQARNNGAPQQLNINAEVDADGNAATVQLGGGALVITNEVDAVPGTTRLVADLLRLNSTTDADVGSSRHALQIGPSNGVNLIMDNNEIIPRNNGAISTLSVGGARVVGVDTPTGSGDAATKGYVDARLAAGSTTITPSAANTPTQKSVSFGKTFPAPPTVVVAPVSTVPGTVVTGVGVSSITTTGCILWVTRTNTSATDLMWIATSA